MCVSVLHNKLSMKGAPGVNLQYRLMLKTKEKLLIGTNVKRLVWKVPLVYISKWETFHFQIVTE